MGMAIRWSKCGRKCRKVFLIQWARPNPELGHNNPLQCYTFTYLNQKREVEMLENRFMWWTKQLLPYKMAPNPKIIFLSGKSLPNSMAGTELGQNNPLWSSLHLKLFEARYTSNYLTNLCQQFATMWHIWYEVKRNANDKAYSDFVKISMFESHVRG